MAKFEKKTEPTPDPVFGHLLPGASNEELTAAQERLDAERAKRGFPRVEFGRDATDKRLFDREWDDPLAADDPLKEVADKYLPEGMGAHFHGDEAVKRLGMRGYRPVINERGDVVKVGTLTLTMKPLAMVEQWRAKMAGESKEAIDDTVTNGRDAVDRLAFDADRAGLGIRPLANDERVHPTTFQGHEASKDTEVFEEMGLSLKKGSLHE